MYYIEMRDSSGRLYKIDVKADCLLEAVDQVIRALGEIWVDENPEDYEIPDFNKVIQIYGGDCR